MVLRAGPVGYSDSPRVGAEYNTTDAQPFQLLMRERRIEAEALIENVKARIRYAQPQKAPASGSSADQGDEHTASSAQSPAPR